MLLRFKSEPQKMRHHNPVPPPLDCSCVFTLGLILLKAADSPHVIWWVSPEMHRQTSHTHAFLDKPQISGMAIYNKGLRGRITRDWKKHIYIYEKDKNRAWLSTNTEWKKHLNHFLLITCQQRAWRTDDIIPTYNKVHTNTYESATGHVSLKYTEMDTWRKHGFKGQVWKRTPSLLRESGVP